MREALTQTQASSSQQWSDTCWESTSGGRKHGWMLELECIFNIFSIIFNRFCGCLSRNKNRKDNRTEMTFWGQKKKTSWDFNSDNSRCGRRLSHLQFSPEEDLTLWRGSIQIEPLIQHQLWFWQQLSKRNHQGTDWQSPAVGELQEHNKWTNWEWVNDKVGLSALMS